MCVLSVLLTVHAGLNPPREPAMAAACQTPRFGDQPTPPCATAAAPVCASMNSSPSASAAGGGYPALALEGDQQNWVLSEWGAMPDTSMNMLDITNPRAQLTRELIARGEAAPVVDASLEVATAPQTGFPAAGLTYISQFRPEPAQLPEELGRVCWQTLKDFVNAPSPDGTWEHALEESRHMLAKSM